MNYLKHLFRCGLVIIVLLFFGKTTFAEHIHTAEIYWECISSGPDAGKTQFFLVVYRDCSINNIPNPTQLTVTDVPGISSLPINLVGTPEDVTPAQCNLTCADEIQDVSMQKYTFATDPVELPGIPPPTGYTFSLTLCCRVDAQNLVGSVFEDLFVSATMYPYNNQAAFPCFDSSPQFTEPPQPLSCAGAEIRYNSNAIDSDLDSLSYSFTGALIGDPNVQNASVPAVYENGFSAQQPLPGPNLATIEPSTGQFTYQSNATVQGRYAVVMQVNSWRCGQLIATSNRDLTFGFTNCNDANNIPTVAPPAWTSPPGASGYAVTVQAGDLVSFSLTGVDNDNFGQPQTISFTAEGAQFASDFTNANGDCANQPCATLSNVTPPSSAVGSVTTEFNWQTDCDQLGIFEGCGNLTNTYNFLFKYRDDYCPASGSNTVNIAVTVVGEELVDSPEPRCADTDANGNITLHWVPSVASPNSTFIEYVIYHSTNPNGPFTTEVATIANINTSSWTHQITDPNPPTTSGPNYYIIQARSGCGNSTRLAPPQHTIASIYLTLTDDGQNATLNWNHVTDPPLPSSNGNGNGLYALQKESPIGTWASLPSVLGLSYVDPISVCSEQVNYQVALTDNFGCVSNSNIAGDVLSNSTSPAPQEIDSVTVENGLARISWLPNPQTNVEEYTIEQNNGSIWTPLFTVVGYNNTDWINPASQASTNFELYRLKATGCNQTGPAGEIHRTVFLEVNENGCERTIDLFWNSYENWPEGTREYEVHVSENGGIYQKIATTQETLFTHSNLQGQTNYCYKVVAVRNTSNRITSTSNEACVLLDVPRPADFGYNYKTTVQPGNTGVELFFFVDNVAEYIGYDIQRGTEPNALSSVWFIPYDITTQYYEYVDAGAQPNSTDYYYSIIGVDDCESYIDTLNTTRTIFLQVEANSNDRINTLEWNAYETWRGNVAGYNIYRKIDGAFDFLAAVLPTELTYSDNVEDIILGDGNFCYYVEAFEGNGAPIGTPNPVAFAETSRSNEACAVQRPDIYVPNAFMPSGINTIFKPVTLYVERESYLFRVFNRWGQLVFETNDVDEGWNGMTGSTECAQGAYVFFISYVSSNGETYTKTGSVTLIR